MGGIKYRLLDGYCLFRYAIQYCSNNDCDVVDMVCFVLFRPIQNRRDVDKISNTVASMTIVNYQLKASGVGAVDIVKWILVLMASIDF